MTQSQKAELRALAEAATPGPWFAEEWASQDSDGAIDACGTMVISKAAASTISCLSMEGDDTNDVSYIAAANPAAIIDLLDHTAAVESELAALKESMQIDAENYEFQRKKADAATATVYQFHYAMKDAGWHPGRTDDNLCDIIREKAVELAALKEALRGLEPELVQHKRPMLGACGNTIGHTNWRTGRGLDWWPHRTLYTIPPNLKG